VAADAEQVRALDFALQSKLALQGKSRAPVQVSPGATMSNAALGAAGLTKRYGSARALDGLDLEVTVGEVHAFLGPNGAGKPVFGL
jgi:ATPase subunit of ABC transporter with duplicated ATPase domains